MFCTLYNLVAAFYSYKNKNTETMFCQACLGNAKVTILLHTRLVNLKLSSLYESIPYKQVNSTLMPTVINLS
jgi:hypothetical protein